MSIKRINEFPDGSGSLSADDIFLFMDDPSGDAVTKKISLSQLNTILSGGSGIINNLNTGDITFSGSTISTANPDQSMTITTNGSGDIYIGADKNMIFDMNAWSAKGILLQDSQEDGYDDPNTPSILKVGSIYHDTGTMVIKSDGRIVDSSGNLLQTYGGVWITNGDQTGFRVPPPTGSNSPFGYDTIITNNEHNWNFTPSGDLILPVSGDIKDSYGNSVLGGAPFNITTVDLHNGGVQNAQVLQFSDTSYQSIITGPTPASGINAQRIIIQGQKAQGNAEGGDVYVWGGDADINGGDIKIYAGDADNISPSNGYGGYVNIDGGKGATNGGNIEITAGYSEGGQAGNVSIIGGPTSSGNHGNVVVKTNNSTKNWTFDKDGKLTYPDGTTDTGGTVITNGQYDIQSIGNTLIQTSANAGAQTWNFDTDGRLSIPGPISLPNSTTVAVGTFDNSTGGNNGISLNCYVGYELNWQGGHLKSTQDNGVSSANIWCDSPIEFPGSGLDNMQIDSSGITFPDGTTQSSANISSANITDFNSSVSGLLTGLQPSGNYANNSHTHTIDNVTDLQTTLDNKAGTTVTQVFTSSGTWTKPTGAKTVHISCIGGGGGGGAGCSGSSGVVANGGGGGSGGGRTILTLDASLLGSTEIVTVGAGGIGAAAASVGTNGGNGTAGGRSTFGNWVTADNGNGGNGGGQNTGGTAGGVPGRSMFTGGNGGSTNVSGSSSQGAAGGGGGGAITSGGVASSGGVGGYSLATYGIPVSAAAGASGTSVPANTPLPGSAGGGGSASTSAAGQAGGNGGIYGGGGGGGGASIGFTRGKGGDGAGGIVVITTYF